jgi:formylglycine-generating enzyme required for sulfatase activity
MTYSGTGTGSMSSTTLIALTPYPESAQGNSPNATYGDGNNYPAYYLCWFDAIIFCNRLSVILGRDTVYSIAGINTINPTVIPSMYIYVTWNDVVVVCNWSANGFRLPTEAEWEYAARGGQKNEYTRTFGNSGTQPLYSGGCLTTPANTVDDVAWHSGNSGNTTHEVKTKIANELGLFDMSGNVREWCWDRYWLYNSCCDGANPKGGISDPNPMLRGGTYGYDATNCYVSDRINVLAYFRDRNYGFRVVCK